MEVIVTRPAHYDPKERDTICPTFCGTSQLHPPMLQLKSTDHDRRPSRDYTAISSCLTFGEVLTPRGIEVADIAVPRDFPKLEHEPLVGYECTSEIDLPPVKHLPSK